VDERDARNDRVTRRLNSGRAGCGESRTSGSASGPGKRTGPKGQHRAPARLNLILTDRRWKAEAADRLVRSILSDIGLEVAEAKSGVIAVRDGFEFLGFQFQGRFLRPRSRALNRFKDEVRQRTRRRAPVSLAKMIEDLNPVIRGWGNYFKVGDVTSLFEDLDSWIRMRLRSKVIRRHANALSNAKMPNRVLRSMGLVSLDGLRRAYLSPGPG
jgi:hypothetical protein